MNLDSERGEHMFKKCVSLLSAAACVFFVVGTALAQESITITTYYPSPYGVYKQLRLSPTDDFVPYAACANEGEMYYDNSDNAMYVCSTLGGSRTWRLAPGGGATWSLNPATNEIYNTFNRNVGIGTIDPGALLELYAVNADVPLIFQDSPTRTYVMGIDHSAATSFNINRGTALGSSVDFVLDSSGRIGIGMVPLAAGAPIPILQVNGEAWKNTPGQNAWLVPSDARIKTDIREINKPLALIQQLHPVKFRYTPEYSAKYKFPADKDHYYFIAQEFRKVFPDTVKVGVDGYLSVDSSCVEPILVAAVQELTKNQDKQARQISALKKEIEELKTRIKPAK